MKVVQAVSLFCCHISRCNEVIQIITNEQKYSVFLSQVSSSRGLVRCPVAMLSFALAQKSGGRGLNIQLLQIVQSRILFYCQAIGHEKGLDTFCSSIGKEVHCPSNCSCCSFLGPLLPNTVGITTIVFDQIALEGTIVDDCFVEIPILRQVSVLGNPFLALKAAVQFPSAKAASRACLAWR